MTTLLLTQPLTPREAEIVPLILQGKLGKEIASHLNISLRAAKFHLTSIYKKFGVLGSRELFNLLGHYEVNVTWVWHFDINTTGIDRRFSPHRSRKILKKKLDTVSSAWDNLNIGGSDAKM